jgi:hypothetical protein
MNPTLSATNVIHNLPTLFFSSILIPPSHIVRLWMLRHKESFSFGFNKCNISCNPLFIAPAHATYFAHPIIIDIVALMIFRACYKLQIKLFSRAFKILIFFPLA